MKSQYNKQNHRAGGNRRLSDRTIKSASVQIGALLQRGWIRAVLAASVMVALPPAVRAQQNVVLANPVHSAQVRVTVGKTEDIRTDQTFANITVGNPDIADVSPLTDHSLSILGKKIGTTRVTVYDTDHKPVGIFDIEVSYDISRLATEIGHFTGGGIQVSSINGRIMLSGTSPDAATLDKAVQIAGQFGPDPPINTVQVAQPQQIELEVRFIEVDRNAGRDLGVQWNAFGNSVLANTGSGLSASKLPITQPNGSFQQPAIAGAGVGGPNIAASALPISPVVAAGVLSGAAPFGFLVGQLTNKLQVEVNALESKGAARL
ncbi:MAG: pilus assembly protein N-terminal domain-containing protein, partial [Xanthobacteraceae bacterium]